METRIKERLTGAAILVALLVIVVPEMLSGPGELQQGADAPPAAPAAEGPPLRSYTAELNGEPPAGEPRAEASPPAAQREAPAVAPPPPAAARAPESRPATASAAPATGEADGEAGSSVAARPAPAALANATPAAGDDRGTRPLPAGRGWTVQVGVFAQADNANRLEKTLDGLGFPAVVSRGTGSGGKPLYRVRVGPVADRAAAVALRDRLAAQGHKGSVVAP
jgi:DedD protein